MDLREDRVMQEILIGSKNGVLSTEMLFRAIQSIAEREWNEFELKPGFSILEYFNSNNIHNSVNDSENIEKCRFVEDDDGNIFVYLDKTHNLPNQRVKIMREYFKYFSGNNYNSLLGEFFAISMLAPPSILFPEIRKIYPQQLEEIPREIVSKLGGKFKIGGQFMKIILATYKTQYNVWLKNVLEPINEDSINNIIETLVKNAGKSLKSICEYLGLESSSYPEIFQFILGENGTESELEFFQKNLSCKLN